MLFSLPAPNDIRQISQAPFLTYKEKNPRMKMYRVCIDRSTSRDALRLWQGFEDLVRWINDRMGKEAVRLFPTTEEAEGIFEVALLVEPSAIDQFEAILPEIRSRIRSGFRCNTAIFESMDRAEPPYQLAVARKSADGWTVDGVEMVDLFE